MFNDIIKLIKEVKTVNEYGDTVVTEIERPVFAQVKSIGQSEFYQAAAVGLKPEIKFVIADFLDYQNEKKLKYEVYSLEPSVVPCDNLLPDDDTNPAKAKVQTYDILRTYRTGLNLEIVCARGVDET
jgi:SPP1 family predicted phage head-tail adaptor